MDIVPLYHFLSTQKSNRAIAAFGIGPGYSYLEYSASEETALCKLLFNTHSAYIACTQESEILSLFVHISLWKSSSITHFRSFGYISCAPYIQKPCEILDISPSGQALLAVLPFPYDPDFPPMSITSSVVRTDFSSNPSTLPCITKGGIKTFKQFHIVETNIEFVYIRQNVPESTRALFIRDIPINRIHPQFSFRTDIVNQCKLHFQAAEAAVSDSEEASSVEYYGNESEEETIESFCPPNTAPEDENETALQICNAQTTLVEETLKQSEGIIESQDDLDWNKIGPSEPETFEEQVSPAAEGSEDDHANKEEQMGKMDLDEENSEEEDAEEEDSEKDDVDERQKTPTGNKYPLLNAPKKHVSRFDEKRWPEVAQILIAAQKDPRKKWKTYAKMIDGGNGHHKKTFKYWYDRLAEDPDWKPSREACGAKNKILCPEADEIVWKTIEKKFVSKSLLFTDKQCSTIALNAVKQLPPSLKPRKPFSASPEWVQRFRQRHMISLRTPHLKRRPYGKLSSITSYVHRLNEALHSGMNLRHIVNADETNWPVVFANKKTWSPKRAGKKENTDIFAILDADTKMSFTVMAAITANGDALPLFMLAKGKTNLCERQLTAMAENEIYHSPSGWVTIQVMEEYFKFLRHSMQKQVELGERDKILLIIDLYASHRQPELIRKAAEQNIELLFIPAGMTAELQPLDAKIFGQLKSVGAANWTDEYIFDPTKKFTKETASINLQESWNEVTRENVRASWERVLQNGARYFDKANLDPTMLGESDDEDESDQSSSSEFQE
jgi:hypothetical protein